MARATKIGLASLLVLLQVSTLYGDALLTAAPVPVGPPLKWRTKVITIALSGSLLRPAPNVKNGTDMVAAVRRSLRSWEDTSVVQFREVFSEKQNVSPQGVGDSVSLITVAPSAENVLLFAKNPEDVAAWTRVFYDARGRISEADIVLNPYQQFSADGTFGTFDLEATLTHEIGHALGLDHSPVRGSSMYESFSKNGVFGLHGFLHRTLSEIDRTALRAKYGASDAQENCCGTVLAKVFMPDGRPALNLDIWLEDSNTGKVISQAATGSDGSVEMNGLPLGSYTLYSSRKERAKRSLPLQAIGNVSVVAGDVVQITKKLEPGPDDIDLKYTGFNGQLTFSSVPINSGKSYTIYIGGRNLSPKGVSIRFSSPYLEVTPGSIASHDYGSDVSVLSFEVTASSQTPVGEYTVFVESAAGGRSAIVGGISVRAFSNPYSNFVF